MDLTLSELFTGLLQGKNKNFYAQVLNALDKIPAPGIKTMGVTIQGNKLVLMYDPEFLAKISLKLGVMVIEHEALHLCLDHIPRFLELLSTTNDEEQRKKIRITSNPAMDCAVNEMLQNDPDWKDADDEFAKIMEGGQLILPERYGLTKNKAYEEYQYELMQQCKVQKIKIKGMSGKGDGGFSDLEGSFEKDSANNHGNWMDGANADEGDPQKGQGKGGSGDMEVEVTSFGQGLSSEELQSIADQLRQQTKQQLKKAVAEHKAGRGLLPAYLEQFLEKYLADPVVPWYTLLTTRIKTTQQRKPRRGIQKQNRKLLAAAEEDLSIIPAIGKTYDPKFRVFLFVDTSGSVSDRELQIVYNELEHLLEADDDMQVRVIQCDANISDDKLYFRGDKIDRKVYGRGGTDFNPPFVWTKEKYMVDDKMPDIVVYYTDSGCPPINVENQLPYSIPVVWLVSDVVKKGGAKHLEEGNYGEVLYMDKMSTDDWHGQRKKKAA